MEKYTINYGITEEIVSVADLDEAKALAAKGMTYTQVNTTIEQDGKVIAISRWYGYPAEEIDEPLWSYGDYGFYDEWQEA